MPNQVAAAVGLGRAQVEQEDLRLLAAKVMLEAHQEVDLTEIKEVAAVVLAQWEQMVVVELQGMVV
jgi:hypothetical protein